MRFRFTVAIAAVTCATGSMARAQCTVPDDCPQLQPGYVCPYDASLFPNPTDPVEIRMLALGIRLDGHVSDAISAGATSQVDLVPDELGNAPGPTGDREAPRFPGLADPNGFNIGNAVLLFLPDSNPLDGVDDSFIYVGWNISDDINADPKSDALAPCQYDADDNGSASNLGGENGVGVPCGTFQCPISDRLQETYQVFLQGDARDDLFDPVLAPPILSQPNPDTILSTFNAAVLMLNIDSCAVPVFTSTEPNTLITKAFPTADGVTNLSNDCIDLELDLCAVGNDIELVIKGVETSGAFGPNRFAAPDSLEASQNRQSLARLLASLHARSDGDASDEEIANVARRTLVCQDDADCSNNDVCDGLESCAQRVCEPGTPLSCDDDDPCSGVETCEQGLGCVTNLVADCNANNVEDACDIANGAPDTNGNSVPDECEPGACCGSDGTCGVGLQAACLDGNWRLGAGCDPNPCSFVEFVATLGCRYLSVAPNPTADPMAPIALRVSSPDWPCLTLYVTLGSGIGRLVEVPLYLPASEWGTVVVADSEVTPGATYLFRAETGEGVSDAVAGVVRQWGDVVAPIGTVNFLDIAADVDCFRHAAGAPPISACDVYPAVPDYDVSFLDISSIVDAFRGMSYPFPSPCP